MRGAVHTAFAATIIWWPWSRTRTSSQCVPVYVLLVPYVAPFDGLPIHSSTRLSSTPTTIPAAPRPWPPTKRRSSAAPPPSTRRPTRSTPTWPPATPSWGRTRRGSRCAPQCTYRRAVCSAASPAPSPGIACRPTSALQHRCCHCYRSFAPWPCTSWDPCMRTGHWHPAPTSWFTHLVEAVGDLPRPSRTPRPPTSASSSSLTSPRATAARAPCSTS